MSLSTTGTKGAKHYTTSQARPQPQDEPYGKQPSPGTRGTNQELAAAAGGGGAQGGSPETRGDISRGVARIRRDLALQVPTIKDRVPGGTSQRATQIMGTELTSVEAKMEGHIQTYERRIREVGVHRILAKERDKVSVKDTGRLQQRMVWLLQGTQ